MEPILLQLNQKMADNEEIKVQLLCEITVSLQGIHSCVEKFVTSQQEQQDPALTAIDLFTQMM